MESVRLERRIDRSNLRSNLSVEPIELLILDCDRSIAIQPERSNGFQCVALSLPPVFLSFTYRVLVGILSQLSIPPQGSTAIGGPTAAQRRS
eukprot:5104901-Pyramimonas_sp.AAC.1